MFRKKKKNSLSLVKTTWIWSGLEAFTSRSRVKVSVSLPKTTLLKNPGLVLDRNADEW